MGTTAGFAEIANLLGDPTRAAILLALLDGRALTAGELARVAGVAPQTASGHLARLVGAGLLATEKQGRHRYHRLASPQVAGMMESILQVQADRATPTRTVVTGPRDKALRLARTCYDHLAGRLGVAISDTMCAAGYAEFEDDGGTITPAGMAFLGEIGITLSTRPGQAARRVLCRPCLDWSERRQHLAGAVGAAICAHAFDQHWIRRVDGSRAVTITQGGRMALRGHFGINLD